jgi:hypothetical protein
MVLLIEKLSIDDAVDLIVETIKKPVFQTTGEARRILDNQVLCARINALLVNYSLMVEVRARDGVVTLGNVGEVLRSDSALRTKIEGMIKEIEGVREVRFTEKVRGQSDHVNPFHNIG